MRKQEKALLSPKAWTGRVSTNFKRQALPSPLLSGAGFSRYEVMVITSASGASFESRK